MGMSEHGDVVGGDMCVRGFAGVGYRPHLM